MLACLKCLAGRETWQPGAHADDFGQQHVKNALANECMSKCNRVCGGLPGGILFPNFLESKLLSSGLVLSRYNQGNDNLESIRLLKRGRSHEFEHSHERRIALDMALLSSEFESGAMGVVSCRGSAAWAEGLEICRPLGVWHIEALSVEFWGFER